MSKELDDLKKLVRKYLRETASVPLRAVDCDQMVVYDLINQLYAATKRKRTKANAARLKSIAHRNQLG